MKNKFIGYEVVRVNPKGGILDNADISNIEELDLSPLLESGIQNQQDLIGRIGVIRSIPYHDEYDEELGYKCTDKCAFSDGCNDECTYGVLIDVVNEDELEFGDHFFTFRAKDLESTGVIREDPDEPREVIRVRVDPETGEGYIVEDDD